MPASLHSKRLLVTEYGPPVRLDNAAASLNIPREALLRYLDDASERISTAVNIAEPIEFSRDSFRVVDVAGLIRLGPSIHLEVRPKFLAGTEDSGWREDFFLIANLVRFGRVLPWEQLHSTISEKGDLADLIAYACISMYDEHRRRPLRVYNRRTWADFTIDGEIDPESVLMPGDRGFVQSGVVLDRRNKFNEVIHHAMGVLLPELHDRDVRNQLVQRYLNLGPQISTRRPRHMKAFVPHRHRRWQELYDLSKEIIEGFGVTFEDTFRSSLPGFIIKTSDAWEALIFRAVLIGMKERTIRKQSYPFADRQTSTTKRIIKVTPDVSIKRHDGAVFVIDAKYKTRVSPEGKEQLDIDASDVYEALAFMRASQTNKIILIYPSPASPGATPVVGATADFERVVIGPQEIIGMSINPRTIARKSGFQSFCANLAATLTEAGA